MSPKMSRTVYDIPQELIDAERRARFGDDPPPPPKMSLKNAITGVAKAGATVQAQQAAKTIEVVKDSDAST